MLEDELQPSVDVNCFQRQRRVIFRAWAETWLDPRFRTWNVETRLPRIRCPLLVLQGEADEYATPAQVEAIARGVRGPVRTLLLPGAGHVPHHQARAPTLAAIDRFVSELRTGASGEA
jgi:pimeloyl-ACP methyl ester carboxylesterase